MNNLVVGVGHCAIDFLGVLPRFPEPDEKIEIEQFSQQGGGPVATALATLAIFGIPTRFIGKVSDDYFGNFIKKGLSNLGVDISMMITQPDKVSPFSFSAVVSSRETRAIFWTKGNINQINTNEIDIDKILDNAKFLLLDGNYPEIQIPIAEEAKNRGIGIIMDAGSFKEGFGDLIPLTDYLVASEQFATEVTPAAEIENSLKDLKKFGPKICIITSGDEGSIGIGEDGKTIKMPSYEVEVVDTTGAGDVYHGAFIYGIIQNWDLKKTMKFATIAAGLKCRFIGGRAGIPTLSKVEEIMNKWNI